MIYLGTQGWSYKDWVGTFYPPGTQARDFLALYAQHFDAVELDTTFYAAPRPDLVDAWKRSTPEGFQFTAKVPRAVTHDRHLVDADDEMSAFLSAIETLGERLGAVLVQLPPDFTRDERPALESFLARLPEGFRFAVEVRHRSWLVPDTYELLRRHGVAWTILDLSYLPSRVEVTADFSYVRWLGDRRQITRMNEVQIDRRPRLQEWAETLDEISHRVERVYGFANNHYSGHSPADINYLRGQLGMQERSPEPPDAVQGRLL